MSAEDQQDWLKGTPYDSLEKTALKKKAGIVKRTAAAVVAAKK